MRGARHTIPRFGVVAADVLAWIRKLSALSNFHSVGKSQKTTKMHVICFDFLYPSKWSSVICAHKSSVGQTKSVPLCHLWVHWHPPHSNFRLVIKWNCVLVSTLNWNYKQASIGDARMWCFQWEKPIDLSKSGITKLYWWVSINFNDTYSFLTYGSLL